MSRYHPKTVSTFGQLPCDKVEDPDVARAMAKALTRDYGDFRSTDKLISRDTNATPKTARNWREGMNTMSLTYFLRLMARSPAVRSEVERLTGLSFADPDGDRDLSRFIQQTLGNP